MKAIGYVRVSTEEQSRHGVSLEAQTERIRAYCVMSNLQLDQLISEAGVSGGKALQTRAGGSELLGLLGKKRALHVVALKLDRLFRDAEDCLRQTREWDAAGITLHIIDMGGSALNTASAMGRMFLTLTAAFAELERNLISERTATALQHKKTHKKAYSPTPFGFDRSGDDLERNAAEDDVLKLIRQWRGEGVTLRAIADRLNESGTATKRGGKLWYASTVAKILGNSIHS